MALPLPVGEHLRHIKITVDQYCIDSFTAEKYDDELPHDDDEIHGPGVMF